MSTSCAPCAKAGSPSSSGSNGPRSHPIRTLYRELLRLRRADPALANTDRADLEVASDEETRTLALVRSAGDERAVGLFNLGDGDGEIRVEGASNPLERVLDSSEERFGGPGALSPTELPADATVRVKLRPRSFALYLGR